MLFSITVVPKAKILRIVGLGPLEQRPRALMV
jgi:hypothetical protein